MQKLIKPVVGFEELYYVTSCGEVFSKDREITTKNGKTLHLKGKKIKQFKNPNGCYCVGLHRDGKMLTKTVHRIVAEAFLPNPLGLPQINHKDEGRTNNHVENLEWCSAKYNTNYGTGMERMAAKRRNIIACYTKDGVLVYTFNSETEAARHFGVTLTAISNALCKGGKYTCAGLHWRYIEVKNYYKTSKNYGNKVKRAFDAHQDSQGTDTV